LKTDVVRDDVQVMHQGRMNLNGAGGVAGSRSEALKRAVEVPRLKLEGSPDQRAALKQV